LALLLQGLTWTGRIDAVSVVPINCRSTTETAEDRTTAVEPQSLLISTGSRLQARRTNWTRHPLEWPFNLWGALVFNENVFVYTYLTTVKGLINACLC